MIICYHRQRKQILIESYRENSITKTTIMSVISEKETEGQRSFPSLLEQTVDKAKISYKNCYFEKNMTY